MSLTTFDQLNVKVQKKLRLVSGTGVQLYAEDNIEQSLNEVFKKIFEMRWWEDYSSWQTYTLDGTLGIPSSDIDAAVLSRYQDIQVMFVGGTNRVVKKMPVTRNPVLIVGSTPLYRDSYMATDVDRIFRIYPAAASGTVVCRVRSWPGTLTEDDTVPAGWEEALYLNAAWDIMENDATNPGGIAKLQEDAEEAMKDLLRTHREAAAVPVNASEYPTGLTEWV